MNTKFKIALLTLLGFSTAACCGTKKAATKKQDREAQKIEKDSVDTRIMLMYGVPYPDGSTVVPLDKEDAEKRLAEIRAEEAAKEGKEAEASKGAVPLPDGRVASPLTEEEAAKRVAEMEAKAEAVESAAPLPDGRVASPLTEEEAAKRVAEMEAKAEAEKGAEQE